MLCLHGGFRLKYDLAHDVDIRGPTSPRYWQTRLVGTDPARYTVILETFTSAGAFNFTTRTFYVTIPPGLTSVDLIFSWSQVRARPADPTEASNIVCTDTMPRGICICYVRVYKSVVAVLAPMLKKSRFHVGCEP